MSQNVRRFKCCGIWQRVNCMSLCRRFDTTSCLHLQGRWKLTRGSLFSRIHQQRSNCNSRPLGIILFYPAVENLLTVPFRQFTVNYAFRAKRHFSTLLQTCIINGLDTDAQLQTSAYSDRTQTPNCRPVPTLTGHIRPIADQCIFYPHAQFLCETLPSVEW